MACACARCESRCTAGTAGSLRGEGKISAEVTVEQIARDLQEYAIQFPHRALVDGVEMARAGRVRPSRDALEDLLASN
jgi:hypothetical protein